MKVKVKLTKEILNVVAKQYCRNNIPFIMYEEVSPEGDRRAFRAHELEFFESPEEGQCDVNWEERRFELVKALLPTIGGAESPYEAIGYIISIANITIAKLKESSI